MSSYEYLGRDVSEWRTAAAHKLDRQAQLAEGFNGYFEGETVSRLLSGDQRDIFRKLLPASKTNWSELVINAVAERLQVIGFRFGDDATDELAWQIWQASQMDADAEMVQTDALVCAHTFVSVWPDEDNPTGVRIYPEHPTQMTVLYAPGDRRRRLAGYKRTSEEHDWLEQLITPDAIITWGRRVELAETEPDEVEPNPVGEVPVVEVRPQPRTVGPPRSELHSVVPIQDRINLGIYNRMVAADFGAFRQLTATGVKMSRRADGSYIAPFNVGADRLLASENPDARIGAIPESELRGYLNAEEADIQHLAAITQTPPHYLLGQMINIPASGMKAAETGLVSKVGKRARHIGEDFESVLRLALGIVGNPGAVTIDAETVWKDFEIRSESELMDALTKAAAIGVPTEELWARYGATPQQIRSWREQNSAAQASAAIAQATALGAADPYAQLLAAVGPAAASQGGPGVPS